MELSTISSFFNKNVNKGKELEKIFNTICFISVNEWHWTQEDLFNTEIPYLYMLLEGRTSYIEEQNKKR